MPKDKKTLEIIEIFRAKMALENITMYKLAKNVNLSPHIVGHIFTGDSKRFDYIELLAKSLEVPLDSAINDHSTNSKIYTAVISYDYYLKIINVIAITLQKLNIKSIAHIKLQQIIQELCQKHNTKAKLSDSDLQTKLISMLNTHNIINN